MLVNSLNFGLMSKACGGQRPAVNCSQSASGLLSKCEIPAVKTAFFPQSNWVLILDQRELIRVGQESRSRWSTSASELSQNSAVVLLPEHVWLRLDDLLLWTNWSRWRRLIFYWSKWSDFWPKVRTLHLVGPTCHLGLTWSPQLMLDN